MAELIIEATLTETDRNEIQELKQMLSCLLKLANEEIWLTDEEVAQRLKISTRTIQRWVKDDIIPYRKFQGFTRFIPQEVDKWFGQYKSTNAAVLLRNINSKAA